MKKIIQAHTKLTYIKFTVYKKEKSGNLLWSKPVQSFMADDSESPFPELREALMSSSNGLCCAHININGLLNKIDQVRSLLLETRIDVLAISETHLSGNISNVELKIENYSFTRKDRHGQKFTGVEC